MSRPEGKYAWTVTVGTTGQLVQSGTKKGSNDNIFWKVKEFRFK